jgi:WD40 repeat protein
MDSLAGNRVWSLAYSPDGETLSIVGGAPRADPAGLSGDAGFLTFWSLNRRFLSDPTEETQAVRSAAFSPDGKLLATAETDGTAKLRDADTKRVLLSYHDHAPKVNGAAFTPDGKTLATANVDGKVILFDLTAASPDDGMRALDGHEGAVHGVAVSPDGKALASCGADRTVRLWDLSTNESRAVLRGHEGAVEAVAFSPDGKILASASWDQTIKLWDVKTGRPAGTLKGHSVNVLCLAFSPDGKTLASGGGTWTAAKTGEGKGELKLWDVATRTELASPDGQPASVLTVTFSPDGQTLASAGWDGVVLLWDFSAWRPPASEEPKR